MPIQSSDTLSARPLEGVGDFERYWDRVDLLTLPGEPADRYLAGFASSRRCVDRALRLRFEVFNVELDEGLAESVLTGLDRDEFDDQMTHLVLVEKKSGNIVGTYRIQTASHARSHRGLYSAQEYDLAPLETYLDKTIELGRACLAVDHRTFRAIVKIWQGIGAFMNLYEQRYLFGCSSLTSQDPDEGWRALKAIREGGHLHPNLFLAATPAYSCGSPAREFEPDLGSAASLPKLFRTYLRLGAKVVSEPAIDRDFGTVDFLVMMDGYEVALSQLDVLK